MKIEMMNNITHNFENSCLFSCHHLFFTQPSTRLVSLLSCYPNSTLETTEGKLCFSSHFIRVNFSWERRKKAHSLNFHKWETERETEIFTLSTKSNFNFNARFFFYFCGFFYILRKLEDASICSILLIFYPHIKSCKIKLFTRMSNNWQWWRLR